MQEIVARLELSYGKGYSGAAADSMSSNLPDVVGDILQTGGNGVAVSVHRSGRGGSCGMEGLDLRLQN